MAQRFLPFCFASYYRTGTCRLSRGKEFSRVGQLTQLVHSSGWCFCPNGNTRASTVIIALQSGGMNASLLNSSIMTSALLPYARSGSIQLLLQEGCSRTCISFSKILLVWNEIQVKKRTTRLFFIYLGYFRRFNLNMNTYCCNWGLQSCESLAKYYTLPPWLHVHPNNARVSFQNVQTF